MRHTKKKKMVYSLLVATIMLAIVILAWPAKKIAENDIPVKSAGPETSTTNTPQDDFNKQLYPTDVASSLWAIVNKGRALPSSYVPPDLTVPQMYLRYSSDSDSMRVRADTAKALGQMFTAAQTDGIKLMLTSGYRSYSYQVGVYGDYVKQVGVSQADTFSARPGHSEHQTGLAADLEPYSKNCELNQCFEATPEGKWLAANCYKYGFIIRYPKGKENLTGYEYEPWHVRYVGTQLAAQIHQTGQTLEQFFGLSTYQIYPATGLTLKI